MIDLKRTILDKGAIRKTEEREGADINIYKTGQFQRDRYQSKRSEDKEPIQDLVRTGNRTGSNGSPVVIESVKQITRADHEHVYFSECGTGPEVLVLNPDPVGTQ